MAEKTRHWLKKKQADGKFHRSMITEEHVSIVAEPGSSYFGHISTSGGSSKVVTEELLAYLDERDVDKSAIKAVGCDGTAVNTGTQGGIIRLLEMTLKAPKQTTSVVHMPATCQRVTVEASLPTS